MASSSSTTTTDLGPDINNILQLSKSDDEPWNREIEASGTRTPTADFVLFQLFLVLERNGLVQKECTVDELKSQLRSLVGSYSKLNLKTVLYYLVDKQRFAQQGEHYTTILCSMIAFTIYAGALTFIDAYALSKKCSLVLKVVNSNKSMLDACSGLSGLSGLSEQHFMFPSDVHENVFLLCNMNQSEYGIQHQLRFNNIGGTISCNLLEVSDDTKVKHLINLNTKMFSLPRQLVESSTTHPKEIKVFVKGLGHGSIYTYIPSTETGAEMQDVDEDTSAPIGFAFGVWKNKKPCEMYNINSDFSLNRINSFDVRDYESVKCFSRFGAMKLSAGGQTITLPIVREHPDCYNILAQWNVSNAFEHEDGDANKFKMGSKLCVYLQVNRELQVQVRVSEADSQRASFLFLTELMSKKDELIEAWKDLSAIKNKLNAFAESKSFLELNRTSAIQVIFQITVAKLNGDDFMSVYKLEDFDINTTTSQIQCDKSKSPHMYSLVGDTVTVTTSMDNADTIVPERIFLSKFVIEASTITSCVEWLTTNNLFFQNCVWCFRVGVYFGDMLYSTMVALSYNPDNFIVPEMRTAIMYKAMGSRDCRDVRFVVVPKTNSSLSEMVYDAVGKTWKTFGDFDLHRYFSNSAMRGCTQTRVPLLYKSQFEQTIPKRCFGKLSNEFLAPMVDNAASDVSLQDDVVKSILQVYDSDVPHIAFNFNMTGSGKTAVALKVYRELVCANKKMRMIVVCASNAVPQWVKFANSFSHPPCLLDNNIHNYYPIIMTPESSFKKDVDKTNRHCNELLDVQDGQCRATSFGDVIPMAAVDHFVQYQPSELFRDMMRDGNVFFVIDESHTMMKHYPCNAVKEMSSLVVRNSGCVLVQTATPFSTNDEKTAFMTHFGVSALTFSSQIAADHKITSVPYNKAVWAYATKYEVTHKGISDEFGTEAMQLTEIAATILQSVPQCKVLVVCTSKDVQAVIHKFLSTILGGDACAIMNGDTPHGKRAELTAQFQENNNHLRCIIALQAMVNSGVSLHDIYGGRPRFIVMSKGVSKPATFVQVLGRIFRFGCKSACYAIVVTKHTTANASHSRQYICKKSCPSDKKPQDELRDLLLLGSRMQLFQSELKFDYEPFLTNSRIILTHDAKIECYQEFIEKPISGEFMLEGAITAAAWEQREFTGAVVAKIVQKAQSETSKATKTLTADDYNLRLRRAIIKSISKHEKLADVRSFSVLLKQLVRSPPNEITLRKIRTVLSQYNNTLNKMHKATDKDYETGYNQTRAELVQALRCDEKEFPQLLICGTTMGGLTEPSSTRPAAPPTASLEAPTIQNISRDSVLVLCGNLPSWTSPQKQLLSAALAMKMLVNNSKPIALTTQYLNSSYGETIQADLEALYRHYGACDIVAHALIAALNGRVSGFQLQIAPPPFTISTTTDINGIMFDRVQRVSLAAPAPYEIDSFVDYGV